MKYLSFRTFLICILLPPAFYLLTLQGLEIFFHHKWSAELREAIVSDTRPMMEGKTRIEDDIAGIIGRHRDTSYGIKAGIQAEIFVMTRTNRLLYPQSNFQKAGRFGPYIDHKKKNPASPEDMARIAENNQRTLQEGIQLVLNVSIPRNSWLSIGILTVYIMLFVFLPYRAYLLKTKEARELKISKQNAIEAANKKLTDAQEKLAEVSAREMKDQSEITQLKADLDLAGTKVRATENEALAELEILDLDLQKNIKLKEELETEVRRLEKELRKIESSPITINKQQKEIIDTTKRFKTLYKNLEISSRAIDGFIDLETNLQLQSEELIHTINEDGSKVPVKRKVYTRKGALPVFECEFGRSGRIYWSTGSGGKRQVWVIGTKNTQNKDLAYIDKL
ncbi:hypothetical protein ER57_02075 [Smithella sp. SCADC]|jgi:hypothetical protein|nr:hypothetical protein ER57_02075 [Smithella sp. SCADC]